MKSYKNILFIILLISFSLAILLILNNLFNPMKKANSVNQSAKTLKIEDIVKNANHYHNREVCAEGIYVSGFEVSAFYLEDNTKDIFADVWIQVKENDFKERILIKGSDRPISFKWSKAKICGLFQEAKEYEVSGGFGHMGRYKYQIINKDFLHNDEQT
jgi:hypothetical protein